MGSMWVRLRSLTVVIAMVRLVPRETLGERPYTPFWITPSRNHHAHACDMLRILAWRAAPPHQGSHPLSLRNQSQALRRRAKLSQRRATLLRGCWRGSQALGELVRLAGRGRSCGGASSPLPGPQQTRPRFRVEAARPAAPSGMQPRKSCVYHHPRAALPCCTQGDSKRIQTASCTHYNTF